MVMVDGRDGVHMLHARVHAHAHVAHVHHAHALLLLLCIHVCTYLLT